ncbi:ABC transporter substrate-binding protein [Ottowia sp.]|uniref:ABC transporter substrate-binding protein n=1 Tax=Ottowia sp. TaxID=1898956 RepID=UPI003A888A33
MKRWLLWGLTALFSLAAHGYEVQDDTGHATRFDAPPQRIVSLLPSLTETICALNACARLVGVDRYSNWPQAVARLPQLGGGLDPSVEAVVALKPDVVVMSVSSRAGVRLRALGLRVVQLEPHTSADARRIVRTLGQLLQVDGADALLRRIGEGIRAAAQALPASARGTRVYFEVAPTPHAAGHGSFIGETMQALGLVNVIGPDLGPFPRINPELVVRAAPQLIMASQRSLNDMARRPGWAALAALRDGHVCAFDARQRDVLVRPGPRMDEAARLMARCVAERMAPSGPGATSHAVPSAAAD